MTEYEKSRFEWVLTLERASMTQNALIWSLILHKGPWSVAELESATRQYFPQITRSQICGILSYLKRLKLVKLANGGWIRNDY